MNCLDFRRLHDTDPGSQDEAFLRHERECASCAAHAARSRRFEGQLSKAMKVSVPDSLASRILLKQAFHAGHRGTSRRRYALGLAASLLLGLGLLSGLYYRDRVPSLGSEVVSLIDEAQHALAPTDPVTLQDIEVALRPVGVALEREIGVVTFASPCFVRGKVAGHLVVQGEKAPISVLLMPSERVKARSMVTGMELRGYLIPTAKGAIAIVGAPGEALEGIEDRVRAAVRWEA